MSARGYATKFDLLPRTGLIFKALAKDGLVDSIGISSILYQSGDASTWQTADNYKIKKVI